MYDHDRIFFYLFDQIFMLFSYENNKKEIFLINFSSPRLRRIIANFTSGRVQYSTRRETGHSRVMTSIQERLVT